MMASEGTSQPVHFLIRPLLFLLLLLILLLNLVLLLLLLCPLPLLTAFVFFFADLSVSRWRVMEVLNAEVYLVASDVVK